MKRATSKHYIVKFDAVLDLVKRECIKKETDFVPVLESNLYWSAKYLQGIFGFVANISLKDYIRRRKLTEVYERMDNFEHQKITGTVNGIVNAKRKIMREFGENPRELQRHIYEEIDEETLERRVQWKLENGVRKRKRKEIEGTRLVLYSEGEEYDLDKTYFIYGNKYFVIKGGRIGTKREKNIWLSRLFGQDVFISRIENESAKKTVRNIYRVLKGDEVSSDNAMQLELSAEWDRGFQLKNLVKGVSYQKDTIVGVNVDSMLEIEGNSLIFNVEEWRKDIEALV